MQVSEGMKVEKVDDEVPPFINFNLNSRLNLGKLAAVSFIFPLIINF